jgi:hypothetical protein
MSTEKIKENEQALAWLYKQLKKKRIALGNAENKPHTSKSEIDDIKSTINTIEWITAAILKGDWTDEITSTDNLEKKSYWANICKMQKKQTEKGLKKYGQILEENTDMTILERLEYLEEELIDGLMYLEHIKEIFVQMGESDDFD